VSTEPIEAPPAAGPVRSTAAVPVTVPVTMPEVPGILSAADVLATARSIADVQRPDGMIPWFPGGHCDPWNHVEAAMALTVCGLRDEAERAYRWLADCQLADGSWFNYYLVDGVKDPRLDTNVCAYLAAGLWHHHLVTGEDDLLRRLWPVMERGLDFVLRWQQPDGSVRWSLDGAGRAEGYALLTGSSSIYHSLRCGVAAAERLGKDRPDWELAAGRLGHAVAHHPGAFAPKDEFAMDWYYPMLSGALEVDRGRQRMAERWDQFVMPGLGVRCVSTNDWVTAAETAECVLALDALGLDDDARRLLADAQGLRLPDGSYWTGMVYPDEVSFPGGERTTYTAAAMVLAADALSNTSPAAGLFRGECLPAGLDLAEPHCAGDGANGCTATC
jgi:MMP endo-(1,4)-3-O-methyl-alpha-D-mannosidase